MHQQFKFNNSTLCPRCIYVFCIYLRTNSELCHLQRKMIGFYNPDEKCLQRGTDWVFKYRGLQLYSDMYRPSLRSHYQVGSNKTENLPRAPH